MELMWTHWRGRKRENEKEAAAKRNVIVAAAAAAEACGMYTETNGWGGNARNA